MKKQVTSPKTKKNRQYIDAFRRHIEILGYAKHGRESKCTHVGEFLAWLEGKGVTVKQVRPAHITTHHTYIKHRPHAVLGGLLSLKTVAHYMQSIRLFYSFLQQRGDIVKHPMSTLTFKHPSKRDGVQRIVLTQAEINELYDHCEWLHERTVLSLAYGCGLRNGEVSSVDIADVKLNEAILIVPKGKGNKRRVIPMSGGVVEDLRNYYENERSQYIKRENERAFLLNSKGDRMMGYTCRKILSRIIDRTGNQTIKDKQIAIHHLRHSIATHLLEEGVSVEQVRNFLGHAHVETTEIYTRVSQEQLKRLIQ